MKDPYILLPFYLAMDEIQNNPENYKPNALKTIKSQLAKFKKTNKYKENLTD